MQIGYERHTIEKWRQFDDDNVAWLTDEALEWWTKWKDTIFKLIEMSPCEPTGA